MSVQIYGTLGPSCADVGTLTRMIDAGMTGIRLNLSHATLRAAQPQLDALYAAERETGRKIGLLIDMQGPELRIGTLAEPMQLEEGKTVALGKDGIDLPEEVLRAVSKGQTILLDDGKLCIRAENAESALVERGGVLHSRKSAALPGISVSLPAMTAQDRENIALAPECGVTGVMQPFVRSADDLQTVRAAIRAAGDTSIRLLAKVENLEGVAALEALLPHADEIVIARGDLGNAVPLWELPGVQKRIAAACRKTGTPFMVVNQMLASMERSSVPTRAEMSDIFNAVLDGAASVMVTNETAVGAHPVEAVRALALAADAAERFLRGE